MNEREIQRRLAKLDALEAGGVDNWEWYDESLGGWHKDNRTEALVDGCIEEINDLLAEAVVDEPVGRGCGYCVKIDEDALFKFLSTLIEESNKDED